MNTQIRTAKQTGKSLVTTECRRRVDSFDTCPSRDQVAVEVPSNIKRLSEGQTLVRDLPLLHCAPSPQEDATMSTATETTPKSDRHAETRAGRRSRNFAFAPSVVARTANQSTRPMSGSGSVKGSYTEGEHHANISRRLFQCLSEPEVDTGHRRRAGGAVP